MSVYPDHFTDLWHPSLRGGQLPSPEVNPFRDVPLLFLQMHERETMTTCQRQNLKRHNWWRSPVWRGRVDRGICFPAPHFQMMTPVAEEATSELIGCLERRLEEQKCVCPVRTHFSFSFLGRGSSVLEAHEVGLQNFSFIALFNQRADTDFLGTESFSWDI